MTAFHQLALSVSAAVLVCALAGLIPFFAGPAASLSTAELPAGAIVEELLGGDHSRPRRHSKAGTVIQTGPEAKPKTNKAGHDHEEGSAGRKGKAKANHNHGDNDDHATTTTCTTEPNRIGMDGNGLCGKKLVYDNWVYSVQPEGEGPTAAAPSVVTLEDKEPFTLPDDMEVVDATQSDWQQILDNVIKPYEWGTKILIVADTVLGTNPTYSSGNGVVPGGAFWPDVSAGTTPFYITWTNQGRTCQFSAGGAFRVLVRSRQL